MTNSTQSTMTRRARRAAPAAVALAALLGFAVPASAEVGQAADDAVDRAVRVQTLTHSDPDGDFNGGEDAPGGLGGADPTTQDRNNGSGNDEDCEDDNRGENRGGGCIKRRTPPIHPIEPIEPIELIEPIKPIEPIEPIEPIKPIEPSDGAFGDGAAELPKVVAIDDVVAPAADIPAVVVSAAGPAILAVPVDASPKPAGVPVPGRVLGVALSRTTGAAGASLALPSATAATARAATPPATATGATAAVAPAALARTGGNVLELSLLGLGLLGLGAVATRSTRSTRSTGSTS